jgi:Tat protein secretion system quality control protein TatD with DNase activity
LLLETDAPDQPLIHGERNTPGALATICQSLAAHRSESVEQLSEVTWENGLGLLGR